MQRLLSIALLVAWATGCEAMVPYHWDSAEKDGERTAIVLETVEASAAEPIAVVVPREGARYSFPRDPIDFELQVASLVAATSASSPRPPAAWPAKTASEFYAAHPRVLDSTARGVSGELVEIRPGIRGFRVERWLGDELATRLEFSTEYEGGAFRVTLERITMHYSRAKVADKSWKNFWSRIPLVYGFWFDIEAIFGASYGDAAVDMQIDMEFTSSSTSADGSDRFAPIAVLGWTVLDVAIGDEPRLVGQSSGWLPMLPPSILDANAAEHRYGQGRFTLTVLVTEQDDLSPQYIADRTSLGQFFNDIMGFLSLPGMVPVP